jgi:formyltetrahydrofolate hydrolase
MRPEGETARLLVSCPDRHGIVAALSSTLADVGANIVWRWRRGELAMDVAGVVSNHPDLEGDVRAFGIPYHHVPCGSL